ncbi:bifunctional phosphoribosylaminoimidazolecarboxamide formyltransferase/IMP cyclohydrolase [bacterium]|nr:bifunctional phosphoribosylaminoimidazolecarboxamide formyltransferase/IMP cyclohydrolase [bacterium]
MKVKRALISVYDKTGILEFARSLQEMGVEIICTEGTAAFLKEQGLYVREVSELTGFPPLLFGRVKTLHPSIFAPILAKRDEENLEELKELQLEPIDLVCVNLYPFEETIKGNPSLDKALEMIDIGGVALLRAAGKNFPNVAVVCEPSDYQWIIEELRANALSLSEESLRALAAKAFKKTALYDLLIWQYLSKAEEEFPPLIYQFPLEKVQTLRYGENPHQRAVFYRFLPPFSIGELRQLGGKELSFNNILDIDGALRLAEEFDKPCAVVVKHTSPCGVAIDEDIVSAYKKARDADAESAYGGVVAVNREVNRELAEEIASTFIEVVVAPSFSSEAIELLRNRRKNLRLVRVEMNRNNWWDVRGVKGGILLQDGDVITYKEKELKVVTEKSPSPEEMEDLLFAWVVCKYVKSNAIVVAKNKTTLGIGGGQPSRVRSAKIALEMAGEKAKGAVLASDGFFPFPDSVELAGQYGIRAIIQPGGSIRDEEVISKANELGISMLFTGIRHFRH